MLEPDARGAPIAIWLPARHVSGEPRRHAMGFVVQVMHRSGAHTDPFIEAYADRRRGLAAEIEALRPHRAELARRRPEAEKQAAVAFARVQPEAAAELARRRERAGLARTVLEQREQPHERAQHRARQPEH